MLIRHADPERDGAGCAGIYSPFVTDSAVSFEELPPDPTEIAARIAQTTRRYPWLVAESDGGIVGYAYASQHRERAAYRWAADVAVYVGEQYRRRGAGKSLYEALLGLLAGQGLRVACAGITLPNDASVALHEACGFSLVGVYRRIGWKGGSWRDVAWWQVLLGDDATDPPAEPGPPARL